MSRNKLYAILAAACAAGYIWPLVSYYRIVSNETDFGICLFKRVTGIPCPSCGSTRSIVSILNGDLSGGLFWNPFGIIIMAILIVAPIWMITDLLLKKDSLFRFYNQTEIFLRRKWIAIPAILLVLMNWIWNIYKGL
jgi:hypothetical protein